MSDYVYDLFKVKFTGFEFSSEQEFEKHKKEADEWWAQNHLEAKEEYEFRIENFNRPTIGAIIRMP